MHQNGTVMELRGENALIRFARTKSCARCGACIRFGEAEVQVELPNTLGAKPGDIVWVELAEGSMLQASALGYLLPLALLLAGLTLGALYSEAAGAAGGVLGALLGYALLRALEPKLRRMARFVPRMIKIEQD